MAGEFVVENIYLATTFGYGGQKRFQKPPLVIAERCRQATMTQKTRHLITATIILLSSGLYFALAYKGYKEQVMTLDQIDKFTGQISERGITTRKSGKRKSTVFYIRLIGLNETLGIYRMNNNYQELVDRLVPGDEVTVYYVSRPSNDVNIDLVQIENRERIIVNAEEFKNKESSLVYIGLIAGILSVFASVWYYKKYIG